MCCLFLILVGLRVNEYLRIGFGYMGFSAHVRFGNFHFFIQKAPFKYAHRIGVATVAIMLNGLPFNTVNNGHCHCFSFFLN